MAVAGPFGAAVGAFVGHLYDGQVGTASGKGARDPAADEGGATDPGAIADRFFRTTFEVMGHVAKADGKVTPEEIRAARAVMADFRLSEPQVAAAIAHFTRGKQTGFDLTTAVMGLRRACAGRPDLLLAFLEIQIRAAIAGTDLRGPARPLLTRVAATLGVGGLEFARIEAVLRLRHGASGGADAGHGRGVMPASKMPLDEAYQVLEIDPAASDDAVVKAYRRQLSRHHPDKLKANGLPESMLEHAKQRTQQIIAANERVREARGLA